MANSAGFQLRLRQEFSGMKLINMEATNAAVRVWTVGETVSRAPSC